MHPPLSFFPALRSVVSHIHFSKFHKLFTFSSCANLFIYIIFLPLPILVLFPWRFASVWPKPHEHSAILTLQCRKKRILKCSHSEKLRIFPCFLCLFNKSQFLLCSYYCTSKKSHLGDRVLNGDTLVSHAVLHQGILEWLTG